MSCNAFHLLSCGVYIPSGLKKADHDLITEYLVSELDSFLSLYPEDKLIIAGDFSDLDPAFLRENFGLVNGVTEATRMNVLLDMWIDDSLCELYQGPASWPPSEEFRS